MTPNESPPNHEGLVQVYTGNGKGKCVSPDTWIATGTGLSTVEDIVGQLGKSLPQTFKLIHLELATHEGPQSAKALYNGGFCDTIKIKTRFGYELEGTPNHPVLTLTPEGLKWQRLKTISSGTYVAIARNQGLFGSTQRNLEDAYLAGLLLGDGYLVAKKRMWRISLSNTEPTIIQTWKKYLDRFSVRFKTYPDRPNDYRIDGKEIIQRILQDLWLDPKPSHEKEIKSRWLKCDRDTIKALLQGLFDTDGSVFGKPPTIEFSSSSSQLAKQVHLLLLHFGVIAKHYVRKTSRKPNYRLLIRGAEARKFFNKIGFRLEKKQRQKENLPPTHNPNVDIIPYSWDLLQSIPLSSGPGEKQSRKGPTPYLKNQFHRLTRFYRDRGVNASYARFIELLEHQAVLPSKEKNELLKICQLHPFWDQIIKKTQSQNQVYDFNVPGAQSFIGNGIINHNTTAALGLGMRAVGHGFRVYMIQFMKGQINYGELEAVKHLPNFTIRQFGRPEFVDRENLDPRDIELARAALKHAREIMLSGNVDFLILDEINCAIDWGLIKEKEVINLIRNRPPHIELILTGRYARPNIIKLADLVSEINEIKHPYQKGIDSRRGSEI